MTQLESLTELYISETSDISNNTVLAKSVRNLQRLVILVGSSDDISPFIQYSAQLSNLTIKRLIPGIHDKNGMMDLRALHRQRERKYGAVKITIRVKESIYLKSKNHQQIDLKLLRLQPLEYRTRSNWLPV